MQYEIMCLQIIERLLLMNLAVLLLATGLLIAGGQDYPNSDFGGIDFCLRHFMGVLRDGAFMGAPSRPKHCRFARVCAPMNRSAISLMATASR